MMCFGDYTGVAWRNGAKLCGDATSRGISRAGCVNDAHRAFEAYRFQTLLFFQMLIPARRFCRTATARLS